MNMQPTELSAEQLRGMRIRNNFPQPSSWYERDIKALLAHADALQAKVARLEGAVRIVLEAPACELNDEDDNLARSVWIEAAEWQKIQQAMEDSAHVAHD